MAASFRFIKETNGVRDELEQEEGQDEEIEEEEERQPEGADSALPEYLPRQARSTRGNPKYTYSDDDDDHDEYYSSDKLSVEETPPFKSNDTIYPTAHDEADSEVYIHKFLEES
ncbi:hypothetical protein AFLA70_345g001421 [Aspergillus flavus AF70]|nr:hypothetical protein AFLA70_345g001421 [Aspergillus flavus AF70]